METRRGTSLDQDPRWKDKNKKLMAQLKFPTCFSKPVNLKKVKLDTCKVWVAKKLLVMLGIEDDVLTGLVFNHLEGEKVDPKAMQIELTGFLGRNTAPFMEELWNLLLSAQESPVGIPAAILEEKRAEIQRTQEQAQQAATMIQRRFEGDTSSKLGSGTSRTEGKQHRRDRSESPPRKREKRTSLWDTKDEVRHDLPSTAKEHADGKSGQTEDRRKSHS
eukprot:GGOE01036202.1.p1 GENE.GGOE01036202.1~~GGOE01036202.1.p1  ORF type:complete len:219 (+),score=51.57 GGOE01036202.1:71-727(+)